ncbi:MAG TPA: carbohydrate ABC transporter permease [Fimbriimonadaceae bacterium]|nr:carbohydrate ABC transporter permease [Fimbriimonadaceae bacterium]
MSAPALFTLGTILTWIGFAAALRALFLAFKLVAKDPSRDPVQTGRDTMFTIVGSGLALFVGGQIAPSPGLHIPLTWVVMPFEAWAVAVSMVFAVVRAIQAAGALNPVEGRSKIEAAAIWLVAAALFGYWFHCDTEGKILFIKGAIPLSPVTALALALLAIGTVAAMVFTARAARTRGIAKAFVIHLTLIVGSILFGLPMLWLVVTSFKEDADMSSPNGIVWIPRVSETVPYEDPKNPAYKTEFDGVEVRGRIIERHPDGTVKLDINRPMSMRGMTADTTIGRLTEVPLDVPLVHATMDGQKITGRVVEEMEDGRERVEAMQPPSLAGRRQVYAPTEVEKIRKIGLRFANYSEALDYLPPEAHRGLVFVQNTLIIVVLGLIGTILSSSIVAYAFSRMRFPGRDVLFSIMLATMMLPGAVTKLPQFMIFKELGWIDTLYPLWVPAFFGSAFNIFLLRQFFKQVPVELEDAAKIDGASYFRAFWSVMMPLVKPAIAVIAILTFVGAWNNFMDPLIYINSPEHMTISYAVQLYSADRANEPGYLTAFTTMSIVPVLAIFFFAQRYFIEGVTLSGMGGR